jgi:hypothetical protein
MMTLKSLSFRLASCLAERIVTTFVCQRNNANPVSPNHMSAATSAEGCA